MKEWECVQLGHHKKIGRTIMDWEKRGWRLHTYQAQGTPTLVNHYLLFERGRDDYPSSVKAAAATAAAAAAAD